MEKDTRANSISLDIQANRSIKDNPNICTAIDCYMFLPYYSSKKYKATAGKELNYNLNKSISHFLLSLIITFSMIFCNAFPAA